MPTRTFYSLARMVLVQGEATWADHIEDELPTEPKAQDIFRANREETNKACRWAEAIIQLVMTHNHLTVEHLWPNKKDEIGRDKRTRSNKNTPIIAGQKLPKLDLTYIDSAGPPQWADDEPFYSPGDPKDVVNLPSAELKVLLEELKRS